jgi:hypothetical protein
MKILNILFCFSILIFAYSCSKDSDDELLTIDQAIIEASEVEATSSICKTDHHTNPGRHNASIGFSFLDPEDACAIKVVIDPICDGDWLNGIHSAINAYNNLPGVGIQIEVVNELLGAELLITCNTEQMCASGRVVFVPGFQLSIMNLNGTTDCDFCQEDIGQPLSSCQYEWIAAHEIMHVFGFAHIEPDLPTHIAGTVQFDPNSVIVGGDFVEMTTEENGFCDCEELSLFSASDIQALQLIYPGSCNDENECPDGTIAPEVDILCSDLGVPCLFVNGMFNAEYPSAPYDICPVPNVSCFLNAQAGDTLTYTFCEWGTDSDCNTGEGCCWEYNLVVPECNGCPAGTTPPVVDLVCNEDGLACLMVDGIFNSDYPSAPYNVCPNISCIDESYAGRPITFTFCEWGTDSDCSTGEGCCWEYDFIIPGC